MAPDDYLEGAAVLKIFNRVVQQRILVRMAMADHPVGGLTLISSVRDTASPPMYLVDALGGLEEALVSTERPTFSFEFTDPEGMLYRFQVKGGWLAAEGLWLPVPERVARIQRRKDFRLTVLPGTRILYDTQTAHGVIKVIDISLGGSLGALVRLRATGRTGTFLKEGGVLENLHLEIPIEETTRNVRIGKARIRRIIQPTGSVRPRCALEFLQIDADQKKLLVETVYALQRIYLQNRRRN